MWSGVKNWPAHLFCRDNSWNTAQHVAHVFLKRERQFRECPGKDVQVFLALVAFDDGHVAGLARGIGG